MFRHDSTQLASFPARCPVSRPGYLWMAIVAGVLASTCTLRAEEKSPVTDLSTVRKELAAKRDELATEIQTLGSITPEEPANVSAVAAELEVLHSLDLVYQSHLAAIDGILEQRGELERLQEDRRHPQEPATNSKSWLILEDYKDQLEAELNRNRTCAHETKVAEGALQAALDEQEQCARRRRRHQDELSSNDPSPESDGEERQLQSILLESTMADAVVGLRRAELDRLKVRQEVLELSCELLREKVQAAGTQVDFSKEDLQTRQHALAQYEGELRSRLAAARQRLLQADKALEEQLAVTTKASPSSANRDEAPRASLETLRLLRRLCQEETEQLERWLTELRAGRHVPELRYRLVHNEVPQEEITTWLDTVEKLMTMLSEEEQLLNARAAELIQNLTTIYRQERIHSKAQATAVADHQMRREAFEQLLRSTQSGQLHVQMLRRTGRRLLQELHDHSASRTESLAWARVSDALASGWSYELAVVGERPITVSKVAKGLFGLVCGVLLAALVSRFLKKRILPRLGFNPGAAEALRSLVFYVLSAAFGMLSLELANVPLTALTFCGGAAAIAVGFASQDLVSNFMSGVILLAEQPIRVGDFVEVGNVTGTVERMGTRSTRLRTDANVEITVPNRKLLGDNVVNLTLSDNLIWSSIKIGVESRFPVSEIKNCLLSAIQLHPRVMATPEPFVLLTDLADKSSKFEAHFLIAIERITDGRRIESELREAIDAAFRAAGFIQEATPRETVPAVLHRKSA